MGFNKKIPKRMFPLTINCFENKIFVKLIPNSTSLCLIRGQAQP